MAAEEISRPFISLDISGGFAIGLSIESFTDVNIPISFLP